MLTLTMPQSEPFGPSHCGEERGGVGQLLVGQEFCSRIESRVVDCTVSMVGLATCK